MVSLIWTIQLGLSELEGNNPSRKRMEESGTPDLGERKSEEGATQSALCLFLSSLRLGHRTDYTLATCLGVGFVDDDEAQA